MKSKKLKDFSRELRKNSTFAEVLLWKKLQKRQVRGFRFLRQKPIGSFIVDFYCHELKLIIEVDGESHAGNIRKDANREMILSNNGNVVLRFGDKQIKKNIEGVVMEIEDWIDSQAC